MGEEVLGWLLPDVRADEQAEVRRVITALRLLRDDARVRSARHVEPSWLRARGELEELVRRQRRRAIDALLHAHLSALRPAGSFLDLGPRPHSYGAAWRILLGPLDEGAERAEPSFPPAPGEPPLAVVERLLEAGARGGAPPAWRALWNACRRHVVGPPAAAERHWYALLAAASKAGARPALRARLLGGLVAARLERFHPARASALLGEHASLAALDPSLRRLFGWSALLCGDELRARELLRGLAPSLLPAPIAELRADVAEWAALLPGEDPALVAAASPSRDGRRAFGAVLLGVFALRREGSVEVVALDAPRAVRAGVAARITAELARERLAAVASCRSRRAPRDAPAPSGALSGTSARALALAAVRDARGELAGWIQLESEHLLLPCAATLAGLARAWSEPILAARGEPPGRSRAELAAAPLRADPFPPDDPRQEFARRLFAVAGSLSGRRAYWIEPGPREELCVRAERGAALADWPARPGTGRVLWRAREARAPVRVEGERGAGLHAQACAGLALPLVDARDERVLGLLALEAVLGEPASERLVAALHEALRALAPLWWACAFRAECRARTARDVAWDPRLRFPSSIESRLAGPLGTGAPVLLVGPQGAGRRTLAGYLAFRRARRLRAPRVLELAELDRAAQLELARGSGSAQSAVLVSAVSPQVLGERGALAPELAAALPAALAVPPLRARRDEIPALVSVLAADVARREALAPARFRDAAVAALWRQDWPGNVAELAERVAELVRAHAGREVGAAEVRAVLCARGGTFCERLPSLRPRSHDLELALETTRHRSGNENRARASRYLGWDPDTLAVRLRGSCAGAEEARGRAPR